MKPDFKHALVSTSLLAAMSLLAGCSSFVAAPLPSFDLPEQFSATAKPAPALAYDGSQAWWSALNEPELDRLMMRLEAQNPNIAIALASLKAASASLDAARAPALPSLGANASHAESGTNGNPSPAVSKISFSASWEIDVWGRIALGAASAESNRSAAQFDHQAAMLSARSSLASAFLNARSIQRQIQTSQSSVARLSKIAQIIQAKIELGAALPSDFDSADASLKGAQADLSQSHLALAQAERAIALACGDVPGRYKMPELDERAFSTLSMSPSIPATLLARRPDIQAAKHRLIASDASRGQADAAILPTLTLGANGAAQAQSLAAIFANPTTSWSIAPAIAATIFDAGARKANARQAESSYDKALASYRQTVLSALSEAEDALDQTRFAQAELSLRSQARKSAAKAAAAAKAQFELGSFSRLDLEQALANDIQSARAEIDAQSRLLNAQIFVARSFAGSVAP